MLIRQSFGLTASQARELASQGFKLKFVAIGCGDKDFYDVYC